MISHVVVLSEGLPGDLRPLCYGRSTWDIPFQGEPLLVSALQYLTRAGYGEIYLLDDTPGLWLHGLTRRLPRNVRYVQKVDARPAVRDGSALELPRGVTRVLLLKPCAFLEPDLDALNQYHEDSRAQATFALVRLDPSSLQWPSIPSCRLDESGRILEVAKLKRTEALGSTRLDNVLNTSAPTRPREFWAPRNVALLQPELVAILPLQELAAPLAGLARSLAEQKIPIYGRTMRGRWWSMSTPNQVFKANYESLGPVMPDASEATIRQMVSRLKSTRPMPGNAPRPKGLVASAAAAVERQAKYPNVHSSVQIEDEAMLGNNVKIGPNSRISGASVVGPACILLDNVTVVRSVLGERCQIDSRTALDNVMLAAETVIPPEINMKHAVVGAGEVQNLLRGVPAGGSFLDQVQPVDGPAVSAYWMEFAPVPDRAPGRATMRALAHGIENDTWLLDDGARSFVLKRRLDRNAKQLIREFHVMRMLHPGGVAPTPLTLDLRPELPVAPCLIMEHVEGRRLQEGEIDVEVARVLGITMAKIHSLPVDTLLRDLPELGGWGYPDLLGYVMEVLGEYRSFLEFRAHEGLEEDDLTNYVLSLLQWATSMAEMENVHWKKTLPQSLCHGDLREFNMVVRDDGRLVLLDWEKCGVGDPAYDMGWLLALADLPRKVEAALEGAYGDGPQGDVTFWERARTYRIIDLIAWPVHLMGTVQRARHQSTRMTAKA
ncbi:MAG: hypothetical protein FJX76_27680, partial [Armatimonadetes bacterium]|nr:hypothetical protein [Armatimonadota bacterium]